MLHVKGVVYALLLAIGSGLGGPIAQGGGDGLLGLWVGFAIGSGASLVILLASLQRDPTCRRERSCGRSRASPTLPKAETVERCAATHPTIAAWLGAELVDGLECLVFPEPHRWRIRSTKVLERFNEELMRRTRGVQIIPNTEACSGS